MANQLSDLNISLRSFAIFRKLLKDPVIEALLCFLNRSDASDLADALSAYGEFVGKLFASNAPSLAKHIQRIVCDDENIYIRAIGRGDTPADSVYQCVLAELEILQRVADLTPGKMRECLDWEGYMPSFECDKIDLIKEYEERVKNIGKYGYGIYARYPMFYLNSKNRIVPVQHPDRIRLHSLIDYKKEQQIILDNTIALLEGKPAANILLTGDAGTGKSSTIKAVVNELYKQGLRILEVRKEQLTEIPSILDELNSNPLKFILFIDDLSFQKDDNQFSTLKAILEGSVSAKSKNVVIYATSNRRHLVKESFSDRDGDDIHRNDTMQEIISLSERFGIHITFQKPNRETYLDIVHHLCREKGIKLNEKELDIQAERFALGRGGRSARAATQFVDHLLISEKM